MPAAAPGLRHALARTLRHLPVVGDLIALAERNRPVVSDGEVAQFHTDGFMVFDPMLPEDTLDRAIRAIPGVVDTGFFLGTAHTVLLAEAGTVRTLRRGDARG